MQTTSWLLQIGGIVTLSFLVPLACADPPPTSAPDPVVHDPVAGTPVTQTTPVQECTVSPAASSVRAVVNGGTVKIKLTVPRTSCATYRVRTEDGSAWARVASSQPVRGSQTVAIAVTRNSGAQHPLGRARIASRVLATGIQVFGEAQLDVPTLIAHRAMLGEDVAELDHADLPAVIQSHADATSLNDVDPGQRHNKPTPLTYFHPGLLSGRGRTRGPTAWPRSRERGACGPA